MDDDDVKKRTQRMLAEARRDLNEHEKTSRANAGKSQFPLLTKLKVAIPCLLLVMATYTFTFTYGKKRWTTKPESETQTILKDVKDITGPEVERVDPYDYAEFMTEANNKKW